MKPLTIHEIQNLHEYELGRADFRRRVIDLKKRRRVALGPLMTLVFENRDTVRFQVQEMLRVERIAAPEKVQDEIDVYNELLPRDGEVAATLFIEVTEPDQVQPTLDRFIGLDEPGQLVLEAGGESAPARFAAGQSREDRISAVHYVRFALGPGARRALAARGEAALSVRHAGYDARTALPRETVEELGATCLRPDSKRFPPRPHGPTRLPGRRRTLIIRACLTIQASGFVGCSSTPVRWESCCYSCRGSKWRNGPSSPRRCRLRTARSR